MIFQEKTLFKSNVFLVYYYWAFNIKSRNFVGICKLNFHKVELFSGMFYTSLKLTNPFHVPALLYISSTILDISSLYNEDNNSAYFIRLLGIK